jgi:colanic acid/amylovoran biosynthesis glycosyltransferase
VSPARDDVSQMVDGPSRRLRLLVVSGPFPAPQQVFIHNKILALARRGHQVAVFSKLPGDRAEWRKLKKAEPHLGIRQYFVYPTPGRWGRAFHVALTLPWTVLMSFLVDAGATGSLIGSLYRQHHLSKSFWLEARRQALLLYAAHSADAVHFEWNNQAASFLEAIQVLGKPTIVSLRGRGIASEPLSNSVLAARLPQLFRLVTKIHSVSEDLVVAGRLFGVDPDKVAVISPAIQLEDFVPPPPRDFSARPFRILTVAGLRWKKNLLAGVLAVRLLKDRGFDVVYDVIGEGVEREALTYAIHDLGLADRVRLVGMVPHSAVAQALSTAHVFLMPSVQEGFCNAVVEAQAMELPVVVTEAEGLRENIEPNVTGLVAHKWSADDIADRLEHLIRHPEVCAEFGAAGRRRAEALYDIHKQIDQFEQLYPSAIDECSARASHAPSGIDEPR